MARVGLVVLCGGLGLAVGCGDVEEGPFVFGEDFGAVEVRLSSGDLTVAHTDGDEVVIDADFGGLSGPGSVGHHISDGVLVIDYDCALCGGDVEVLVPDGVPVDATVTRGDLHLERLTGSVLANVQAGAISGEDLACDAHVSTRAGEIELAYAFRPRQVLAETTFGSIDLTVPSGAYAIEFGGNVGVVNLWDVENDPDSPSSLVTIVEAGEITIRGTLPE